ncbi:MAG: lysozyme inhibitor LprI family protein [Hyphomonas sp.]
MRFPFEASSLKEHFCQKAAIELIHEVGSRLLLVGEVTRLKVFHFVLAVVCCISACVPAGGASRSDDGISSRAQENESPASSFDPDADEAAKQLIEALGPQQTFARLGWQQNADYKPAEECFELWADKAGSDLSEDQISGCEAHAADLSRLYASYGTVADPLVFKSSYFWAESDAFNINTFPQLVAEWEASSGNEEDASFLKHPVCAGPLQEGWTGSDFFYDGSEHPLCRLYKIEVLEALEPVENDLETSRDELDRIVEEISANTQADRYKEAWGVEGPDLLASFRASQTAWRTYMEAECHAIGVLLAREPTAAADHLRCEAELTRRRSSDLRRIYL